MSRLVASLAVLLVAGCAGKGEGSVVTPGEPIVADVEEGADPGAERSPEGTLAAAEEALAAGEPARAVGLFARFLAGEPEPAAARQATLGLARAHEALGDCAAAIRTYGSYLTRFPGEADTADILARQGACHAELEQWDLSAESYAAAAAKAGDRLPSFRVEVLARLGFAHFQRGDFAAAEPPLREADAVFLAAQEANSERFTTYYFIGMARFYLGAIEHRRFQEVPIRMPEKVMAEDFAKKFEILTRAQDAYNYTIKAKHMFWVSAAGYQLGSLFEEFYDALMYAPVPEWLDDKQRQVYYEELKDQLRPVVNKAIWVFEKNLETARRLGYESEFIERTEAKLSDLQSILLAGDTTWGKPHPRLAPESRREIAAAEVNGGADAATGIDAPSAADRKLFIPEPTPL